MYIYNGYNEGKSPYVKHQSDYYMANLGNYLFTVGGKIGEQLQGLAGLASCTENGRQNGNQNQLFVFI